MSSFLICSDSRELYVLNSCTSLTEHKVALRKSNFQQIDGNYCLRIADCGCSFETWVSLKGSNKYKVFETIGQDRIIHNFGTVSEYFEGDWGKVTRYDDLVAANPGLWPRNYVGEEVP